MQSLPLPGTAHHIFADMLERHPADTLSADVMEMEEIMNISVDLCVLISNVLPLTAVCCTKRLKDRQALDEVIVTLSITAMLLVLVPGPFGVLAYVNRQWIGGATTCEFYQVTSTWFQLVSICLVTLMCVERWTALRNALQFMSTSHTATRLGIVAVYIIALVVAILPLFELAPPALSEHSACVSWLMTLPETAQEHVFAFVYLVLGCANIVTAFMLCVSQLLVLRQQDQSERIMMSAYEKEFSVLVVSVTVLSHAAWIPTLVLVTLHQMGVSVNKEALFYSTLSVKITGVLNPGLYALCSIVYRRAYVAVLCKICRLCNRRKEENVKKMTTSSVIPREEVPCCSTSTSVTALLSTEASAATVAPNNQPADEVQDEQDIVSLHPSTSRTRSIHQQTATAGSCLSLISEEDEEEVEEEEDEGSSDEEDEEGETSDTEGGEESDDGVGQRQVVTYHTVVDESSI